MHIMPKLVRPPFVSTKMFIPVSFCLSVVTHSISFNFINMKTIRLVDVVEIRQHEFNCPSLYLVFSVGIFSFIQT